MRAALHSFVYHFRIARDVHGQDLIEYALLLGLLATAGGAFLPQLGDGLQEVFSAVRTALNGPAEGHHHHH